MKYVLAKPSKEIMVLELERLTFWQGISGTKWQFRLMLYALRVLKRIVTACHCNLIYLNDKVSK